MKVHEVGICEGQPFFSMEYVAGGTLAAGLAQRPQTPRTAAVTAELLARAVHAAHLQGVVHRDLKPSNILLTLDGTPKVTDFGLAKRIGDDGGLTQTGQIVGTPGYMAPEQANREALVGVPADVYALGAVLYEMLVGRPPFEGGTAWETLMRVVHEPPAMPSSLARDVPRDLDVITLKCLAKEPAARYPSADALAEDLRRYLAGEPILARPVPVHERAWKWARRRPAGALALLSVVASAVLLSNLPYRMNARLREKTAHANAARDAAEASELRAHASARRADASARKADAKRDLAIKAFDRLSGAVTAELKYTAGMQRIRRSLRQTAIDGLKEILADSDPASPERSEAVAHYKLGDLYCETGKTKEAIVENETSRDLAERLAVASPGDPEVLDCLREACRGLGEAILSETQPKEALDITRKEVELAEALAARRPGGDVARGAMIGAYDRLGRALHGKYDDESAKEAWLRVNRLVADWVSKEPSSLEARESLGGIEIKLAEVARDNEKSARLEHAATIYRALVIDAPDNTKFRRNLCVVLNRLAIRAQERHDLEEALRLMEDIERQHAQMLESDPENIEIELQHIDSQFNTAFLLDLNGRYDEAAGRFQTLVTRITRLKEEGKLNRKPIYADKRLRDARDGAELAEDTPRALDDLALAHSGRNRFRLLSRRAAHHAEDPGGEAELLARIRVLHDLDADEPDLLCNHACHLSRCVGILGPAASSTESRDLRSRCVARALAQLTRSLDLGLSDPTRLENESDFDAIRDEPEFVALVGRLRAKVWGGK